MMIEVPIDKDIVQHSMQFKRICYGYGTGLAQEMTQIQHLNGYIAEHQIQNWLGQPLGALQDYGYQADFWLHDRSWDIKTTTGNPNVPTDKIHWTVKDQTGKYDPCDYYLFALKQFYWEDGCFDAERSRLWLAGYATGPQVMLCPHYRKGQYIDACQGYVTAANNCFLVPFDALMPLNTSILLGAKG